jgi:uncharacterized protein (DUF1501 family)
MLTIWGEKQEFCDGLSRRSFLRIGALGAGLTLADLLRGRARAAAAGRPTSNKSAIMVYLPGGPSHLDTYDPKPNAPREFRGEFKPINTNVPGIQICELLPEQARMFDRLAVIRSVISVNEHSDSLVMTGYSNRENLTANHPSFGSVVSRVRGDTGNVPPFVSLRGLTRGTEPGFLGMAHRPFNPSGPGVQDLRLASGMTMDRVAERRTLLTSFDGMRRELDTSDMLAGLDSFTSRAFEMVASGGVRTALDLSREPASTRTRYRGIEQFLTARRLVEAGVGCVTLAYGSWDTHAQNFRSLRRQLPVLDHAIANLVQDLRDRGLNNEVTVIVWGEFGRTPRINRNAGRDHWPQVMSALIAGGGMRMGQAIGTSSARGESPQDRPYTVSQVLSTIYRVMGIDPAMTFMSNTGRPVHVLDDRTPVRELI